jgi:hypothetical protein
MSSSQRIALTLPILLLASTAASACEPVLPLAMLFSGGVIAAGSLAPLGVAVGAKSVLFCLLEKRLPKHKAVLHMLAANAFSTILGLPLVLGAVVPPFVLIGLPLIYATSLLASRRLVALKPLPLLSDARPWLIALVFPILYVMSFILLSLAQGIVTRSADGSLAGYWAIKLLYVYMALVVSITLTTLWEEWLVSKLARLGKHVSFLPAVTRANLITLGLLMTYAAIRMLPMRLQRGDHLVRALAHHIYAALS